LYYKELNNALDLGDKKEKAPSDQKVRQLACLGLTVWEEIFLAFYAPSPPSPSFKVCFPVRPYKPDHFRLDAELSVCWYVSHLKLETIERRTSKGKKCN